MAGNLPGAVVPSLDTDAGASDAVNLADATRMLNVLAADAAVTFQTFDDDKAKRKHLSKVLHGNLQQHADGLAQLNTKGAGVFVMVNDGDGHGRKAANVRAVRALFVDLDGAPLAPVQSAALVPHLITETSPGRFHALWRVSGCALETFTPMQTALARKFGGDPTVKDLPRVMRLAGFWHRKAVPFQSRILAVNERAPYTLAELRLAFGLDALASAPRTSKSARAGSDAPIPQGSRNDALLSMAAMFRTRGFSLDGVLERLLTINQTRCQPPMPQSEVEVIAGRAFTYPVHGYTQLPHRLLDCDGYRTANFSTRALLVEAMRQYDGTNNEKISLTLRELKPRGFRDPSTLSDAIQNCIERGLLFKSRRANYGKRGQRRECALYGIVGINPTNSIQVSGKNPTPDCINR